MARMINQALGGAFVAPWDVDDLSDDFIDAVLGMVVDLPKIAASMQKVEDIKAKWRAGHPTYRK